MDVSDDEAFELLKQLLNKLPRMQRTDERYRRASQARLLLEKDEEARLLSGEIDGYDAAIDQALTNARAAADADDKEAEGHNLGLIKMYSELKSSRLAVMQRAQDALRDALKIGNLTLDDPLLEFRLSDDEYAGLEQELLDYQEQYLEVYEHCRRIEGLG